MAKKIILFVGICLVVGCVFLDNNIVYSETKDVTRYLQEVRDNAYNALKTATLGEARFYAGQTVVAAQNANMEAYRAGLNIPAVFINDIYEFSKQAEVSTDIESLHDYARKVIAAAEELKYTLEHKE